MIRKILLIWLFLLPFSLIAETDRALASLYLDEAFYYYDRENFPLAENYLTKAMDFSTELPEAWYLGGLLREEQGDRLKSLGLYNRSIALTDVYTHYYYDLYYRYLGLLNITTDHEKVVAFFEEHRDIFESENEILLKVSDSAYRYGLVDYSRTLAAEAYGRNPYNLKSLLYLVRTDSRGDYTGRIRMALDNLERDSHDEIVFQQLILRSEEPRKGELTALYRDIFGETAFYHLLNQIKSELINNSRNLMIRSYGDETLGDGVYFGDYNFDGISDEIVSVSGDRLTYLKDENQDNMTDLSINFRNGVPFDIFLNDGASAYVFTYSEYPYLSEVSHLRGKVERSYKIYPGTAFTPLEDLESFSWKYDENRKILSDDISLHESDLMNMSYLMAESFSGRDGVFREYSIRNGEVTGIREDSLGTGHFDYFLDIAAWEPDAGRRDLNSDGIIDIYEYYEDGKISGIAIDWNNNGKPEYIEDWSVLHIKSWDFNEDRLPDAEYIHSIAGKSYYTIPIEQRNVKQYDIYSWDFSYENFWFNNN